MHLMDSDHDALDAICPPLSRAAESEVCRLTISNVPELPDTAECPRVVTRPVQNEPGISRWSAQNTAVFLQLPEPLSAGTMAGAQTTAQHMLATTPSLHGVSPLMTQVSLEAAHQPGGAAADVSAVSLQLTSNVQSAASANFSTSALPLRTSSGGKLLNNWQPGRTQVGFALQPDLNQPCSTVPLQQPFLPTTVLTTGNLHAQQEGRNDAPGCPAIRVRRRSSSSSGGGAGRDGVTDTDDSPAARTSRCNSAVVVSPGLQARLRAAELAAAGTCDPVSWAAAEAEAIQADKEAAAAAARQAQQQHLQEELEKRQAEAARVAMQVAEAKEHFSDAAVTAAEMAAAVQLRLQQQQQQQESAASLQCHGNALPGRLATTDPDSLHATETEKRQAPAVCAAGVSSRTVAGPAVHAATRGVTAVDVTSGAVAGVHEAPGPHSSPDVADAGSICVSPNSQTSLPPPEFLLQDISLVVTSSLFEGSRGSSPQPHTGLEAVQPQHTSSSTVTSKLKPVAGHTAEANDLALAFSQLLQPVVHDSSVSLVETDLFVAAAREPIPQPSTAKYPSARQSLQKRPGLSVSLSSVRTCRSSSPSRAGHAARQLAESAASGSLTAIKTPPCAAVISKRGAVVSKVRSGSKQPPAPATNRRQQQGVQANSQQHNPSGHSARQTIPTVHEPGSIFSNRLASRRSAKAAQTPSTLPVSASAGSPAAAGQLQDGSPESPTSGTSGAAPRSPASGTMGVSPKRRGTGTACKSPRSPIAGTSSVSLKSPSSSPRPRMSPKASVRPPWNCNIKAHARGGSSSSGSSVSGTPGVRSPAASPPLSPSRTPSPKSAASETSRLRAAAAAASRIPLPTGSGGNCAAASTSDQEQAVAAAAAPVSSSNFQQVLPLSSTQPNLCSTSQCSSTAVVAASSTAADTEREENNANTRSTADSSSAASSNTESEGNSSDKQQLSTVCQTFQALDSQVPPLPHSCRVLSSDNDCVLMPAEPVVGRSPPCSSGKGFLDSIAAISGTNSNLSSASVSCGGSSPPHEAAIGQVCSSSGSLSRSILGSIGGQACEGKYAADADGCHDVAGTAQPAEAGAQTPGSPADASEAERCLVTDTNATLSSSLGVSAGVNIDAADGDSGASRVEEQSQQQQQQLWEQTLPILQPGTNAIAVCGGEAAVSSSVSSSAADGAAGGVPVISSTISGSSTIAGSSADDTAVVPLKMQLKDADVQYPGDKQTMVQLQHQQEPKVDLKQQQQQKWKQQQQQENAGSVGSRQDAAARTAAPGDVSGLSAAVSADSAELLLSPLPFGAVPRKLMSRQSSEQSFHSQASDNDQPEVTTPLTEQHMHSPAQFLLSMSMSCSPHKVDTLESTITGNGASRSKEVTAVADLQDVALGAVDGARELLQKVAARGDVLQQQRQQEELSDRQQQQQQQRGVPGSVAGHQRLQQLIPQRQKPRQQQMPARILTWSGSGSPRANPEQLAAAAAVSDSSQQQVSARVLSWGNNVPGVSVGINMVDTGTVTAAVPPSHGSNTASSCGNSYTQACNSLPMAILRQGSGIHKDYSGASGVPHSSSSCSRSAVYSDEGGGRHGGSNVLAALIQHDTRITSSFKSALLESLCSEGDGGDIAAEQQQQQRNPERGGRHMRRGTSDHTWQQQQQQCMTAQQQDQQQQNIAHVVAFSFPRTSSIPAFGGRGCLAPSMSNNSWHLKSPSQQQQQQQQRPSAATEYQSTHRPRLPSCDDTAEHTAAHGAGSILTAAPVLRLSRSSGNLQSLSSDAFSAQRARLGSGSGLSGSGFNGSGFKGSGFSPISEGTSLTITSSSSGGGSGAEELQQQQSQQEMERASSSPAELTCVQQQLLQNSNSQNIQAPISAAAAVEGSKRQKGLLSAQMQRGSNTATVVTSMPMPYFPRSPVGTNQAAAVVVDSKDSPATAAENRVRGGRGAAAALLGLTSADANAHQAGTQQQQQGSVKKNRVSWADSGTHSSSSKCVGSSNVHVSAVNSPKTPSGTAAYSMDTPTTPLSLQTAAAATAAASVSLSGSLVSNGPASAGLPPVAPCKTLKKRKGLMRHSKSCMEFSSLTATAAAAANSEQQPPMSPTAAGRGDGISPQRLILGADTQGASGGGEQQQQQQVNVFVEAFAAKGSVMSSIGAAAKSRAVGAGVSAADGGVGCSATCAADEMSRSPAIAVPAALSKSTGAAFHHSRSAPADMRLLSCSWHEIEPLEDEEPAQYQRLSNGSSNGSRMLSRDLSGSYRGLPGSASTGPAVYSYAGDFYGSSKQRSSSFTAADDVQQQLVQGRQQHGEIMGVNAVAGVKQRQQLNHGQHQQSPVVAAGVPALPDVHSTQHARTQQQQQQHQPQDDVILGLFERLWSSAKPPGVRQRHVGQQQRHLSPPLTSSAASSSEGDHTADCDCTTEFDLSGLMLMGQIRSDESAQALRWAVGVLQQQPGGSAVRRVHNE